MTTHSRLRSAFERGGHSRRDWLRLASAGVLGSAASGWLPAIARAAGQAAKQQGRHCVLLWMSGGPSQLDTFDMKPGHAHGGPLRESATSVPGLRISEHLPQLAQRADALAILRGVSTKEGDHQRGTVLMRTGSRPGGPVAYPAIGCSVSKAIGSPDADLPNYISIASGGIDAASLTPGFLGPRYAATPVAAIPPADDRQFAQLNVDFLQGGAGLPAERQATRLELWRGLQDDFIAGRPLPNVLAQDTIYQRALRMLSSDARDAFDLSTESEQTRTAYGEGTFGQGCLMARRLIERGVPMVEVALGDGLGWDTHADNFAQVRRLSQQLDAGWATLMRELDERGLLQQTTFLWIGEFGRTPQINANGGRDHFPNAWSCVLAGGGIAGGQTYGATSADGMEVVDGRVDERRILATLCAALGVDPATENMTAEGRPIAIADGAPIREVLT